MNAKNVTPTATTPHATLGKDPTGRLSLFPQTTWIADDGHVYIGGLDTVALAEEFGTPLYIYDGMTIRSHCRAYRDALAAHYPAPGRVAYASKAFLCTAIARLIAQEDLDFEAVSGGELHVALRAGIPAARIHIHGNNKSHEELVYALDAGAGRIVVDNLDELRMLERLTAQRNSAAGEQQPPLRIWLRISPDVDAHTHAYQKTGLRDSKFGIPLANGEAKRVLQEALTSPRLIPVGLHTHIGSQIFEMTPFIEAVEALLDFATEMEAHGFILQELSPGGGLGVRYTEAGLKAYPTEADWETGPAEAGPKTYPTITGYVQAISEAVVEGCRARRLAPPQLVLEPGRSIVAQAGVALYTVGAHKAIPGARTYISVDGGIADNPRPALYGARYTALLANKAHQPCTETVTVAGKFCESGDILIHDICLPQAEAGDLLAVPVSGAYNLALSSNYNQALRPAVVIIEEREARLILRRENYDDLTYRDIISI